MEQRDRLTPLYEQVRRAILAEIDSGARPEGSFLPAEPELCAAYGVSRITLRRALSELVAEGRLIRQQGRGTLVAPRKVQQTLISLSGFSEIVESLGRTASHRVLALQDAPRDPEAGEIAERLGAAALVRFDRLLQIDGRPRTLEALWFDRLRLAPVIEPVAQGGSFFAALREQADANPASAERRIDVGFATAPEREVLEVTPSQPVYRIEKTVFGRDGKALALSRLVTPCHLVTFIVRS